MEKDLEEINRIERLTQEYFNNDEIRSGLKVSRSLMDMYPKQKDYYINYIGFLPVRPINLTGQLAPDQILIDPVSIMS